MLSLPHHPVLQFDVETDYISTGSIRHIDIVFRHLPDFTLKNLKQNLVALNELK